MKILPPIANMGTSVAQNIKMTRNKFTDSQKEAVRIADRAVKIYGNSGRRQEYLLAEKTKKLKNIVTPKNLPVIGFCIGLVSPILLGCVILGLTGAIGGLCWWGYDKATEHSKAQRKLNN